MGLQRLFLVPEGAGAMDGAYLAYPLQHLLGVVALQSQRARCLVVGEDLGTVPEGFSDAMSAARMLSYSVLWFERDGKRFRPPSAWRPYATACVSTHDLPTLTGWWLGADIDEWHSLNLMSHEAAVRARQERLCDKRLLLEALRAEGMLNAEPDPEAPLTPELAGAIHHFVAATPSLLALIQADDLAGERQGVNLPGTDRERPNWRRRHRLDVATACESLVAEPLWRAMAERRSAVGGIMEPAAVESDR
jgi:glycogen operon protein